MTNRGGMGMRRFAMPAAVLAAAAIWWSTLAWLLLSYVARASAAVNYADAPGQQAVASSFLEKGVLYLVYRGAIVPAAADWLRATFEAHAAEAKVVALVADSPGGSVREGELIIEQLRRIKVTHRLVTVVAAGSSCSSMLRADSIAGTRAPCSRGLSVPDP
jgi:ClpP class serine protease